MVDPDTIISSTGKKSDAPLYTDLLASREGQIESDIRAVEAAVVRGMSVALALKLFTTKKSKEEYLSRNPAV